ncbi:hypothetical protein DYU05_01640 [Mucilaginibacter terrenus]|uniref:Uncharacterized protein n=1 Tax=Mucilaginibacter terrenus TaxID=2482727 RepID=A0A3E2NTL0_9SPHI|nr:hypothetical protein [Mucilaginibacter terrenus]RFZ84355.1 hypothetical protein DYU05_01640 [Mucilaginibacter terrenus]
MRYADYNKLSAEEQQKLHWRRHPRVRTATIFSVLFALVLVVFLLRVFQNRRMHVNRKPNKLEAFTVAKGFIKDKLKQPATATFPNNKFESVIDTASNSYQISSTVSSQDSTGTLIKKNWQIQLGYTGGDWADKKSWKVGEITIK